MDGNGRAVRAQGVIVEVVRGGTVESRHRVHVAVVDSGGRVKAWAGDAGFLTFARSSIKAIQALPLVEDGVVDRFGVSDAELAVCCASHSGEPYHVEAVLGLLGKVGLGEDALACGPHAPWHAASARALAESGAAPGRVHNNCSGKHAGMLALARLHDWPTSGYHEASHPVQRRMLAEVARWTEIPEQEIGVGVDGCGVATFAVPLAALAGAFARLGSAAQRIFAAIRRHPEYVAGIERLCTDLIRATGGRVVAKVGAEGVYVATVPEEGVGIALKVEDGARRAVEPALLGVLKDLGLISAEEYASLERYAEPVLTNTRGEAVGVIRTVVSLEAARG